MPIVKPDSADTVFELSESACFGRGSYALFVRNQLMVIVTKNYFSTELELSIGGGISAALASHASNKTVVEYRDCNWIGFRVSLCDEAAAFSLHHQIVVQTSPDLAFTVDPSVDRDAANLVGIAPGSNIMVATYSTGKGACLSPSHHRDIFNQLAGHMEMPGADESPAPPPPHDCVDDIGGVLTQSGQDCSQVLQNVHRFGMTCLTALAGTLSQLLSLSGVSIPASMVRTGTMATICPASCDSCENTPPPLPLPPPPPPPPPELGPTGASDCADDETGVLAASHHSCAQFLQAVRMF
eukprot:SAG22_NODE_2044_length_3089_cov_2.202341_4_plen_297_part_00